MTGTPILYGWPITNWQKVRADIERKVAWIRVCMERICMKGLPQKPI